MQVHDLPTNPPLDPPAPDPSAMSVHSSPIRSPTSPENTNKPDVVENDAKKASVSNTNGGEVVVRRERPSRACTQRAVARMQAAAKAEASMAEAERKRKRARKERLSARLLKEELSEVEEEGSGGEEGEEMEENGAGDGGGSRVQCSKIITPLLGEPEPSQLPRWNIRSMWELASILNFLNVFRPLLNIKVEFSADELETALISPNNMLADVHMPLLKSIPPVTRMALGHNTWITVLCRKLRDWWHWVAEGDLPLVASHGAEIEAYSALDPGVRVVILKALCDIRVEQEDIRNYIDDSMKKGVQLSFFRKERLGGDSQGTSYWYEDDPVIGQRLYREIRKVEVKKGKGRNIPPIPPSSYQWEAVATNLDEFQNVIDKLFPSKNRTEVSVAKKLKNDMLPEIEKVHKRKEKLLKKQHRQALMLDNMIHMDGLGAAGRSLRDRKPVTYTFDDYDQSINEALKATKKKQSSPKPYDRRDLFAKLEAARNGKSAEPSQYSENVSFSAPSPDSMGDEFYADDDANDDKAETLDRSNRRKQRPQRYSAGDFVEAVSDNDVDFDSDDDIVGEVVYDDDYLKNRKRGRKTSSSSEGDEEYDFGQENHEEDEEEEPDDVLSTSEDSSDRAPRFKTVRGRTRRESKLRSVNDFNSGLRRSNRATRNRINYRQIELSESDIEPDMPNAYEQQHHDDVTNNGEFSMGSPDSENVDDKQYMPENQSVKEQTEMVADNKQDDIPKQANVSDQEDVGVTKRRFLDLNELAPGSGFEDGLNPKDEDADG